jgi:hypothetical protein
MDAEKSPLRDPRKSFGALLAFLLSQRPGIPIPNEIESLRNQQNGFRGNSMGQKMLP